MGKHDEGTKQIHQRGERGDPQLDSSIDVECLKSKLTSIH